MIDDDEGPPAGSNQGKSSKRRRTRESESAKKPSTTKEPPRIKNQRNIVIRKRVEDLQLGIKSYHTKLNLEQPNKDASDFLFKEDYTIVYQPRAVIYRDRNEQKKMLRIDEVHKFSDRTLTRIRDKLDFMVKDFKLFEYNKGMENRI
ncbi:hypothetical protein Tco_0653885 [Tanacetum coccineum]|uniref:Uncharacterized protein n=1 Tax=Tanacetum coccineum TaxID=301880 RepID=A0ABQ4X2M1_9ASTR